MLVKRAHTYEPRASITYAHSLVTIIPSTKSTFHTLFHSVSSQNKPPKISSKIRPMLRDSKKGTFPKKNQNQQKTSSSSTKLKFRKTQNLKGLLTKLVANISNRPSVCYILLLTGIKETQPLCSKSIPHS